MHELLYLKKQLDSLIQTRIEKLANGHIKNMEEYRSVTGEKTGLTLAISEINDLLKKQEAANGDT